MQFVIVVFFICFFIFLFSLYLVSRDDFVLLRKDVSLEKIFNLAFSVSLLTLFLSRFFYGIFYSKSILANPFVFLLVPYYPGLSLTGAVVGGALVLVLLLWVKDMPIGRILDFFSISFLSSLPIGILGYYLLLLGREALDPKPIALFVTYVLLLGVFVKIILPYLLANKLKDGTLGLLFLVSFSAISLIGNKVTKIKNITFTLEDLVLALVLLVCLGFIVRQEDLLWK